MSAELVSRHRVRALKNRRCDCCSGIIGTGVVYIREAWLLDGELYVHRSHHGTCDE